MMVSLMLVMVISRLLTPRRGGVPRPIWEGVKPSPTTADPNGSLPLSFFNKMSPCLLLCAVTILFSVWTFQRNLDWQNPVTFWHDSTVKSPTKWRPNYNLAKTLYDTEDIDGALGQYEKTVLLHPTHVHSLNNLANILIQRGDIDGAIRNLHRSLAIAPDETTARVNLGNALVKKGMIDEAVVQYQLALRQNPNQKEIYMNLGMALAQGKKWEAAMDIYGRGVTLFPDYPGIRLELANAMAQSGKAVDAIYHYEILSTIPRIAPLAVKNKNTVLATLPSDDQVRTLFKTALLFTAEKNFDPAIGLLQEASVLTPDNAMIYYNIACLYALNNNKKDAVDWLHLAVEKGYDDWNHLKTDPDMNNIRNEPAFQRMIEKY
jgi:tetratricopeptide (TPR) repeat protein